MVGEVKKDRYIYYHCTGYKGRCDEPYVREEILEKQFSEVLSRLSFDEEVLAWVCDALRASHADEKREHEAAIGRLRAEYDRLQARVHAVRFRAGNSSAELAIRPTCARKRRHLPSRRACPRT
jgi:site-specific DNA recombinase